MSRLPTTVSSHLQDYVVGEATLLQNIGNGVPLSVKRRVQQSLVLSARCASLESERNTLARDNNNLQQALQTAQVGAHPCPQSSLVSLCQHICSQASVARVFAAFLSFPPLETVRYRTYQSFPREQSKSDLQSSDCCHCCLH